MGDGHGSRDWRGSRDGGYSRGPYGSQDSHGSRDGGGSYGSHGHSVPTLDEPLESRQQRYERAASNVRELDSNKNGQIEATEVTGSKKYVAEKYLGRVGIPPNFPISVDRILSGLKSYYLLTGTPPPASTSGSPSTSSGSPSPSSSSSASRSLPTNSATSFGSSTKSPTSSGFGTSSSSGPSSPSSSTSGYSSSSNSYSSTSSSSSNSGMEARISSYAGSLLRMYDQNKNGSLEKEEWSRMRTNMQPADRNGDGVITQVELTSYMVQEMQKRSGSYGSSSTASSTSGPSSSSGSTSTSTSTSSATQNAPTSAGGNTASAPRSYRFLTPTERLPGGLPEWFLQKDANRDGQVSMVEFSNSWSDSTASEFAFFDLNGDGVVTPQECLRALREGNKSTVASASK